jgi:hypothetical protein
VCDGVEWINLVQDKEQRRTLANKITSSLLPKRRRFSWSAEQLLASQEGPCSMEFNWAYMKSSSRSLDWNSSCMRVLGDCSNWIKCLHSTGKHTKACCKAMPLAIYLHNGDRCFIETSTGNFIELYSVILHVFCSTQPLLRPHTSAKIQVGQWVRHHGNVRLVDGSTCSPLSWLHCLTTSHVLSHVPSVSGRNGSQMQPSLGWSKTVKPRRWISAVIRALVRDLTLLCCWKSNCMSGRILQIRTFNFCSFPS